MKLEAFSAFLTGETIKTGTAFRGKGLTKTLFASCFQNVRGDGNENIADVGVVAAADVFMMAGDGMVSFVMIECIFFLNYGLKWAQMVLQ